MTIAITDRISASRLMRLKEVVDVTSTCKATIYLMIRDGRFPRPVAIGKRRVGWRYGDVVEWLESRKTASAD